MVEKAPEHKPASADAVDTSREALRQLSRGEPERHPLILALVGPVGAPMDPVQEALRESLRRFNYQVEDVHLSSLLDESPYRPWGDLPKRSDRDYYQRRMDAGDQLRGEVGDGSALAALAIARIAEVRVATSPATIAFVLRSLKHPGEVDLLRHTYGDAVTVIGVASSLEERRETLVETLSLFENPAGEAERLITRDEADPSRQDYGQNVRSTYASVDVYLPTGRGFNIEPEIDRFVDSLFGAPFITPRMEEEGMRLAFDASLRSAAAGRQVGAALIPTVGTPVVVGTNEVPKPGGGQYWSGDRPDYRDFQVGSDPNPVYTRRVVQEVLERLASEKWLIDELRDLSGTELLQRALTPDEQGKSVLADARAAALIEFTRCLHAEQAAIINAARAGVSTQNAVLFTTTFPCHECAKMIVGAGIVEVHYIEPYPKSLVARLYRDVIDTEPPMRQERGLVGGKVPFYRFVGVAPRRYGEAFTAGARKVGDQLVTFDRLTASPRSAGWSEAGVAAREASVVASITRLLMGLEEKRISKAQKVDDEASATAKTSGQSKSGAGKGRASRGKSEKTASGIAETDEAESDSRNSTG
jgi:deoxycytidylate deaminase